MPGNDKSWTKHSQNWDRFGPPLRPTAAVVESMRDQITQGGRILMLGVTPEIHAAFDHIIAVDRDPDMIRNVWPGDDDGKAAIQGDWLQMKWPPESFDGVVCDGGLSMLENLDNMRYFQSLCMGWIKPGGTVVHRVFQRPHGSDSVSLFRLRQEMRKPTVNWHAFKWLMAFYIAERQDDSRIRLSDIMDLFNDLCKDRQALSVDTGWSLDSINTIDLYQGSDKVTCFGTEREHLDTIPSSAKDVGMWTVPGYDLHEHCPLMRWRKP